MWEQIRTFGRDKTNEKMGGFNYVDILILVPLLYGAYKGFTSGLIVEVSTLFALIFGVLFSMKFAHVTERFLLEFIEIPASYSYYVAFAVTFLAVVLVIHLLGKLLTRLLEIISLGLFNRLFGVLFGMLKSALVVCVVLFILDAVDRKYEIIPAETKSGSMLYLPLVSFSTGVYESVTE